MLERSSNSPQARSRAQRAAEERYPRMSIGLVARGAFLEGVAWALPEVPDGAVIEAMARALAHLEPGEDWPTNDELGGNPTGTRDDEFREAHRDDARAAYAAMRGAMQ